MFFVLFGQYDAASNFFVFWFATIFGEHLFLTFQNTDYFDKYVINAYYLKHLLSRTWCVCMFLLPQPTQPFTLLDQVSFNFYLIPCPTKLHRKILAFRG